MRLRWDTPGSRKYQTGVDRGVLYLKQGGEFTLAYPWNGLVSVTEKPTGAESTPLYADEVKAEDVLSFEDYEYTIEAYTYPDAFEVCDGSYEIEESVFVSGQERREFGFCYRTRVGEGSDYILKLIYDSWATVSESNYETISDSFQVKLMSWDVSTVPMEIDGFAPSAWIAIDSRKVLPRKLQELEDILYGTSFTEARLPYPDEIIELFSDHGLYPALTLYPSLEVIPRDA